MYENRRFPIITEQDKQSPLFLGHTKVYYPNPEKAILQRMPDHLKGISNLSQGDVLSIAGEKIAIYQHQPGGKKTKRTEAYLITTNNPSVFEVVPVEAVLFKTTP